MSTSALIEFIAREHPAFVHLPIGLVVVLPLAMVASMRSIHRHRWVTTAFFLASLAWLGGGAALFSGLFWGRQIALIPEGAFFPVVTSDKQVLQGILRLHEFTALAGFLVGALCVSLLYRAYRRAEGKVPADAPRAPFWHRGVGWPALLCGLVWLGTWGACGKLGGVMVFGSEETNKAAAEAEKAKRADAEAELPIRALDYASLEPVENAPVRSAAHGNRWRRIWVTASGIDAYKAGEPLPPGAYVVMTTYEDHKGKPGFEPGPTYMKEMKADLTTAFAFYWPKVPEALRKDVGGQDYVYWRSPDPNLASCLGCHEKGGPSGKP